MTVGWAAVSPRGASGSLLMVPSALGPAHTGSIFFFFVCVWECVFSSSSFLFYFKQNPQNSITLCLHLRWLCDHPFAHWGWPWPYITVAGADDTAQYGSLTEDRGPIKRHSSRIKLPQVISSGSHAPLSYRREEMVAIGFAVAECGGNSEMHDILSSIRPPGHPNWRQLLYCF